MTEPVSSAIQVPVLALGDGTAAYEAVVDEARDAEWANRLFDRDASLWTTDPDVAETIAERLGWLDAPAHFTDQIPALEGFGDGGRRRRFHDRHRRRAWAAAAWRRTSCSGRSGRRTATSICASSTRPIPTRSRRRWTISTRSRPCSSSPASRARPSSRTRSSPTPGPAPRRPSSQIHHHVYENPGEHVRGDHRPRQEPRGDPPPRRVPRGLPQPARHRRPLQRADVRRARPGIADRHRPRRAARVGVARCSGRAASPIPTANPGVSLGLAIGTLAKAGRDKLTFLPDDEISAFGAWVEQLIAESTGKHGVGIVPVDLEPLGPPRPTATTASSSASRSTAARTAAATRWPTPRSRPATRSSASTLADPIDLGAEFVRWEVATAISGIVLGIDPFDQPNVEEAKQLTRDVLAAATGGTCATAAIRARRRYADDPGTSRRRARELAHLAPPPAERLPRAPGVHRPDAEPRCGADRDPGAPPRCDRTRDHGRLRPALPALDRPAAQGRRADRLVPPADRPTTRRTAPIPGWPYTFGQLIDAQAAGDYAALEAHDLPILRVHLGADPDAGLAALERAARRGTRHSNGGLTACASASSASAGWAPTWSAGSSGTGTRSSSTTGRREKSKEIEAEGEGAKATFSIADLVAHAREAARGLDHGPGRRRHRGPDRGAARAPRAGRHDHRRRQHQLPRRRPAPRSARRTRASTTSTPGRRGGIWGLQVGFCLMVGGDARRSTPLEPDLHDARARRRLPARRRPGRRPLREDGPQRHRVRPDAGLRRRLRDHARERLRARPRRRSRSCGCRAPSSARGCSSSPARAFKANGQDLDHLKGWVADSGEGRWTVQEAIDHDVPAPVITLSLLTRFRSRQDDSYGAKVLAALRNEFGGHAVKTE